MAICSYESWPWVLCDRNESPPRFNSINILGVMSETSIIRRDLWAKIGGFIKPERRRLALEAEVSVKISLRASG